MTLPVKRLENGKLEFNFQYTDILFDSLLDIGIRPFVELGLMPEVMAKDREYVFWWKMNISMPRLISEWEELVEAFVSHLTHRYGKEEVKKWYFEIWNEPNHPAFFTEYENIDEYFRLYDAAARAVKRVNSEYRVGGPATAGMKWIEEIIDHCREKEIPLDFISSHNYGVDGDFDAGGNAVTVMRPVNSLSDRIRRYGELCKKEKLPLIVTEWSSSYSPRDPVHDSYFNAVFVLNTIKRADGYADMFSYWTYTDIFEESSPPDTPFHGGFGLINVQSVPKPSFYAYSFLNKLGDTEIACSDEQAYVCKSDGEVQILFWNIVQPEQENCCNRDYFSRLLPPKTLPDAQIKLDGLESDTEYNIRIETVGYKSADPYSLYIEGDYDGLTTREKTSELIQKSKPAVQSFALRSDCSGSVSFTVLQTENQADFITVSK